MYMHTYLHSQMVFVFLTANTNERKICFCFLIIIINGCRQALIGNVLCTNIKSDTTSIDIRCEMAGTRRIKTAWWHFSYIHWPGIKKNKQTNIGINFIYAANITYWNEQIEHNNQEVPRSKSFFNLFFSIIREALSSIIKFFLLVLLSS